MFYGGDNMCQVAINIPEEVLYDTCMNRIEAEQMVKRATALYCYVNHHVSIGYCAEIAGMSIEDFMFFLGENKVSVFNYAEDEIQEDFNNT